jgi:hypothetical protein
MIGDVRVQEYSYAVERCVRRGVWVKVQPPVKNAR